SLAVPVVGHVIRPVIVLYRVFEQARRGICAPQRKVVRRQLSAQGQLDRAQVRSARLSLGAGSRGGAAQPAEKIDLPRQTEVRDEVVGSARLVTEHRRQRRIGRGARASRGGIQSPDSTKRSTVGVAGAL